VRLIVQVGGIKRGPVEMAVWFILLWTPHGHGHGLAFYFAYDFHYFRSVAIDFGTFVSLSHFRCIWTVSLYRDIRIPIEGKCSLIIVRMGSYSMKMAVKQTSQ
jgi:hypothetical protein